MKAMKAKVITLNYIKSEVVHLKSLTAVGQMSEKSGSIQSTNNQE